MLKNLKKDDIIGLLGGLVCVLLSEYDREWALFWLTAGVGLIAWAVISVWTSRVK